MCDTFEEPQALRSNSNYGKMLRFMDDFTFERYRGVSPLTEEYTQHDQHTTFRFRFKLTETFRIALTDSLSLRN